MKMFFIGERGGAMDLRAGQDFQLWEYRVSHGLMLIRSPSTPERECNIDIVFADVTFLQISRFMHNLSFGFAPKKTPNMYRTR